MSGQWSGIVREAVCQTVEWYCEGGSVCQTVEWYCEGGSVCRTVEWYCEGGSVCVRQWSGIVREAVCVSDSGVVL